MLDRYLINLLTAIYLCASIVSGASASEWFVDDFESGVTNFKWVMNAGNADALSSTTGVNSDTGVAEGLAAHVGDNLNFNGASDTSSGWIQVNGFSIDSSHDFTLSVDLKFEQEGDYDDALIFFGDLDGGSYYRLGVGENAVSTAMWLIQNGQRLADGQETVKYSAALTDDTWYHAIVRWDVLTETLHFQLTETGGEAEVASFSITLSGDASNTTSIATLAPGGIQFGFGTYNDRASFDNVLISHDGFWMELETFNSYGEVVDVEGATASGWVTPGSPFAVVAAPGSGDGYALLTPVTPSVSCAARLDLSEEISTGKVGLRFRMYATDKAAGSAVGLANGSDARYDAYNAYISFSSDGTLGIRDGGTNYVIDQNSSVDPNTWYTVWLLADKATNRYEAWISGGVFTTPVQLTHSGGDSIFGFRSTGVIREVQVVKASNGIGQTLYLDDIDVDYTGTSSPLDDIEVIPEFDLTFDAHTNLLLRASNLYTGRKYIIQSCSSLVSNDWEDCGAQVSGTLSNQWNLAGTESQLFVRLIEDAPGAEDLAQLQGQFIDYSVLGAPEDSVVSGHLAQQLPDGSWPDIDYTSTVLGNWPTKVHLRRMLDMAESYADERSGYHADPTLKSAILDALDYWLVNDFKNSNWFNPQIGIPEPIAFTILIMGDDMPQEMIDRAMSTVLSDSRTGFGLTGQNKIWKAGIELAKGWIRDDVAHICRAADEIWSELRVTTGEGLQSDWSFYQHGNMFQIGTYGLSFAQSMVRWVYTLNNTYYATDESRKALLRNFLLKGHAWVLWQQDMDLSACARQIDKGNQSAKGETVRDLLERMSVADEAYFSDYMTALQLPGGVTGSKVFWRSDYAMHRRPNWYASVRMCSSRIEGGGRIPTTKTCRVYTSQTACCWCIRVVMNTAILPAYGTGGVHQELQRIKA